MAQITREQLKDLRLEIRAVWRQHLPAEWASEQAVVMALSIGQKEGDGFSQRKQYQNGPARSFYQFEKIGIQDVIERQPNYAKAICKYAGIPATVDAVYDLMGKPEGDELSHVFARLALRNDPQALPPLGDAAAAHALYVRTWRPGAWTRGNASQRAALMHEWVAYYQAALSVCKQR